MRKFRKFLFGFLIALAALATLAVVASFIVDSRDGQSMRRAQARNQSKQLGLGLHNYHDVHKSFPRGTAKEGANLKVEQRLSWLATSLAFFEESALYEQLAFDEPWDSPNNKPATDSHIPLFLNPCVDLEAKKNVTHSVGLAGVGAQAPFLENATDPGAGVFGYDRVTTLDDIKDGTENTMMVLSVNEGIGPWAQGGRGTIRALTKKPYFNGPDGFFVGERGFTHALFCDGSVRQIREVIDPELLEAMATIQGGEDLSKR